MATRAQAKRTIKLRQADAQGREFLRVDAKNKTEWASCNIPVKPEGSQYWKPPGAKTNELYLNQFETNLILSLGITPLLIASSAFAAPVTATYALANFQLASTATLTTAAAPALPGLSNLAGLLAGTQIASIWLSPDVKTPEFTNLNKPCDKVGKGKF